MGRYLQVQHLHDIKDRMYVVIEDDIDIKFDLWQVFVNAQLQEEERIVHL